LVDKVLPIIHKSQSTLVFTNTRAQCEIWYQQLLEADPMLAGQLAMHHGSLSREIRDWVEESLHSGRLKAVVCTSSLDLGVDFRPVETVIQIGSPKGVGRFMQRAGRAGHQPGATSKIYFLPTHSLEIIEGAALRRAVAEQSLEARQPYLLCFDVLIQYLVTLAVSDGFFPDQVLAEVRRAYSYSQLTDTEWQWCLDFISKGGKCLYAYDEYKKVEPQENGSWLVTNAFIAKKHRLGIGAIVSDAVLQIKFMGGKYLGAIEEGFIAQLKRGDVFWYAGKSLEFVRIKDMTVQVRKSGTSKGKVPTWAGGRMPLSSELAAEIRELIALAALGDVTQPEMEKVLPLLDMQQRRSHLPAENELLIEYFHDGEGHHLLCYPFEGRAVHEGLSALLAYRIARLRPITFSIAVNDYGFELLSDLAIPVEEALEQGLLATENLLADIQVSVNSVEMARRRFRDIAGIAGLVFKGFPGKEKMGRHLQANSQLFFGVFSDYEPDNLLLLQAYREVMQFQLQESRLSSALQRINQGRIVLRQPAKATPFAFPLMVTRWREKLSSEKLADRIQRMKVRLEKN
ncbi:MAG: helicase-related protein, partial [Saprospiraceae bacterium]